MNNRRPKIPAALLFFLFCLTFRLSASSDYYSVKAVWTTTSDTIIGKDQLKIFPFNLEIIAPSAGVQFFRNKVIFLSSTKDEHKMSRSQISFGALEIYSATVKDTTTGDHNLFSPSGSFSFPADGITFSTDGSTMYYTMIPKKGKREQLYKAVIDTSKENIVTLTTDQSPLPFCNASYGYSHPALSSDNNIIIFASDMPGTTGGMDLYMTTRKGDSWSDPENLGIDINSAKNEFWPFLDEYNNLYFSSDRFGGQGGYDIYTCKFNGMGWNKPVLLDMNINTQDDDIALVINRENGRTGFFSRRTRSSKGIIQLYRIVLAGNEIKNSPASIAEYINGSSVNPAAFLAKQEALVKNDASAEHQEQQIIYKNDVAPMKTAVETEKKPEITKENKVKEKEAADKPGAAANEDKQRELGTRLTSDTSSVNKNRSKANFTARATDLPKKQDLKISDKQDAGVKRETVKTVEAELKNTETKNSLSTEKADARAQVIYKVQLLPVSADRKAGKMNINGVDYKISEYMYLGAVRYTIGEFIKLQDAVKLLRSCRQAGYDQSFVVAFRDSVRALEPELFK